MNTGSDIISAFEFTWESIHQKHPDLPTNVVFVMGTGNQRGSIRLGSFRNSFWNPVTKSVEVMEPADENTPIVVESAHEVFIGGETMAQGAERVLETLLHEAAHALATARGIKETSSNGRYHNKRFVQLAEELTLEHDPDAAVPSGVGKSEVVLTDLTKKIYENELKDLANVVSVGIDNDRSKLKKQKSPNLLKCVCGCGHIVRMSLKVMYTAKPTCSDCGETFLEA